MKLGLGERWESHQPDEMYSNSRILVARFGQVIVWSDGPRIGEDEYDTERDARRVFLDSMYAEAELQLEDVDFVPPRMRPPRKS